MFESCLQKQEMIKKKFLDCVDEEQIYQKIIQLGQKLSPLSSEYKIAENKVSGCQSVMYLHAVQEQGKIIFFAESESLMSRGLAALLINVYSGETAEAILKCPPKFLEEIGISSNLTPNRANGLYSIHLKMKQFALDSLYKQK